MEFQVDMQFADLNALLQLPAKEHEAGCNLTLANLLFALISGASVFLFDADYDYLSRRDESGSRFKRLLTDFYPWDPADGITGESAAELLYVWARNPLTHSFGIGKAAHLFPGMPRSAERALWLKKWALSSTESDEALLGRAPRPAFLTPTLTADPGGIELSVPTLTWGTVRMFRALFGDDGQRCRAEELAGRLLRYG